MDFFQRDIAARLLERLDYIHCAPMRVLDITSAFGFTTELLAARFPQAKIVTADVHHELAMLAEAQFDLVFSNLCFYEVADVTALAQILRRVLRPGGVLLFSSLGPDTLREVKTAFAQIDQHRHVQDFLDMHHVGDALRRAGLMDPVMDMEQLTLVYDSLRDARVDLRAMHAGVMAERKGLLTPRQWQCVEACLAHKAVPLQMTVEVVYGHAWGNQSARADEVVVPVTKIGRM